ncbi:MAG TPA: hemerythrin domain-containing protein [Rhodocyclaceae bacterium]
MTLLWRKQLEIGDDRIDTDHKYLICLVNTVELSLRTQQHRDILMATLDQLAEYTELHFEREESIMLSIRYKRYDQHRQQHQLLIKELEAIGKRIEAHAEDALSDEECEVLDTVSPLDRRPYRQRRHAA